MLPRLYWWYLVLVMESHARESLCHQREKGSSKYCSLRRFKVSIFYLFPMRPRTLIVNEWVIGESSSPVLTNYTLQRCLKPTVCWVRPVRIKDPLKVLGIEGVARIDWLDDLPSFWIKSLNKPEAYSVNSGLCLATDLNHDIFQWLHLVATGKLIEEPYAC